MIPGYSSTADAVSDEVTGLTWPRVAPPAGDLDAGIGLYTWDATGQSICTAQYYCANLNLDGFATRWRIPTLPELFSLVETGAVPTINQTEFPDTAPGDSWTSTPDSPTACVWAVHFGESGGSIMRDPRI